MISAGVRPLRTPGLYHAIGAVLFATMLMAAWNVGARAIKSGAQNQRLFALSGILLITPFALMAFLWVGLGPPNQATPNENQMRYLVLSAMTIAIVSGFVVLKELLSDAGERFHSTIGLASGLLGGPLYLVFDTFAFAVSTARLHGGELPAAFLALNPMVDLILFLAGALTYLATAAFAVSLGKVQWLGRGATRTFMLISLVALSLLIIRGTSFPDPKALATPWYTNPGFIVGIPAVPFIIPYLFGVVLLRRAGSEGDQTV